MIVTIRRQDYDLANKRDLIKIGDNYGTIILDDNDKYIGIIVSKCQSQHSADVNNASENVRKILNYEKR